MTTDEAIAYLEDEAVNYMTVAAAVEDELGANAAAIRARAAKLKACADALRRERAQVIALRHAAREAIVTLREAQWAEEGYGGETATANALDAVCRSLAQGCELAP